MFLAGPGEYPPCEMFTMGHFILLVLTIIGIAIALKLTLNKDKKSVRRIIRVSTVIIWCLEIFKIAFSLKHNNIRDVNTYLPLYYCSLLLYAGLLSSFGKGKLKRAGDVFLATGGIIGGVVFLIFPSTSLTYYPMLHFSSIHSFVYHGIMIYLGLLLNITNYIELELSDIKYYASLVGIVCAIAYIVNRIFDSNLMFISQESNLAIIKIIYKYTGQFFSLIMSAGQMTIPFYLVYDLRKAIKSRETEVKYISEFN